MTEISAGSARQTILAVDDTPDVLTLLTSLLKDKYRIKVANSGERALKIASAASPPDLVLLDVVMPGIDGYVVCRKLKALPVVKDVPVIFLTSRADVAHEQAGFDAGAVDYIPKPISPPLLRPRSPDLTGHSRPVAAP